MVFIISEPNILLQQQKYCYQHVSLKSKASFLEKNCYIFEVGQSCTLTAKYWYFYEWKVEIVTILDNDINWTVPSKPRYMITVHRGMVIWGFYVPIHPQSDIESLKWLKYICAREHNVWISVLLSS